MIDGLIYPLTLLAILGTAAVGGLFFAFSVLVMRGLNTLPFAQGIVAMQRINASVRTPFFVLAFVGTLLACLALAVASVVMWDEPDAPLVLAGSLTYLIGGFALTIRYHLPRNEALAALDPAAADAASQWARYVAEWTVGNHLRAAASLAATVLLAAALAP